MGIITSSGTVVGDKYSNVHENIYWNSKLISSSGYGNAPDKWYTQGAGVTITSEHPYNKGFSTSYNPTINSGQVLNFNDATPSAPHWKGAYTTFSGATNYSGNQNSSLQGGWESGEGAIMKMVYDGSGSSGDTKAVRAKIWKNYFTDGPIKYRQSFFYFIESGKFSSGYFAGYAGVAGEGGTTHDFEDHTARHLFTNLQSWTYINHAAGSYTSATANNSSQAYLNGFGFTPGTASVVWIAIPGLTAIPRTDGKTINITSSVQNIGEG
jgi:phospholipase/lecithinase/hemolysin